MTARNESLKDDGLVYYVALRFAAGGQSLYRVVDEIAAQNTMVFLLNNYLQVPRGHRKGVWGVTVNGVRMKEISDAGVSVEDVSVLLGLVDMNDVVEVRVVTEARRKEPKED